MRCNVCLIVAALLASGCRAAPMTGGNVIALRLTAASGARSLTSAAAVISIDEITPTGTIVQTLSVASTGTYACTLPGTSTSISGKLTIGAAGLYASFACINAAGGTASVVSTTNKRGAVFVYPSGSVTSMTLLTQYTSPPREAYCATANTSPLDYYMAGVGGNVRGLSYSTSGTVLTIIDTSKVLLYNDSLFVAAPTTLGPGVGVHLIGSIGDPPTTGSPSETLVTVDTATSGLYTAQAQTSSFVFGETSDSMWVCDSGGSETRGVWEFTWDGNVFRPLSAADRVWDAAGCLDVAAQFEQPGGYTLYFIGDMGGGNGVYRMATDVAPPFVATLIVQAASISAYRGVSLTALTTQSQTRTSSVTASLTPTSTSSQSASASPSQTRTGSQAATISRTPSLTPTPSRTPSGTSCFSGSCLMDSPSGWALASNAVWLQSGSPNGAPAIRLTAGRINLGGTALYNVSRLSIWQGFSASFDIQYGPVSSPPADALSLVFYQDNSTSSPAPWLCDSYPYIGGGGCLNSATRFALVFNPYNGGAGTITTGAVASPSGFSTSVSTLVNSPLSNAGTFGSGITAAPGVVLHATVSLWRLSPGVGHVQWTATIGAGSASFSKTLNIDDALAAAPSTGDGTAWIGFAGSTGGKYEETWVSAFSFQECPPSLTQSPSATTSSTGSASLTRSRTPSATLSASSFATPSGSPTASTSQSPSAIPTPGSSVTPTASSASTASRSTTPTASQVTSISVSPTASSVATASGSPAQTSSQALTKSATSTASAATTASGSSTPSSTQAPSATASGSGSSTPSTSMSPVVSISATQLQSTSQTATRSRPLSPSHSPSGTCTPSASQTRSVSRTPSGSGSLSSSASTSVSASQSLSQSVTQPIVLKSSTQASTVIPSRSGSQLRTATRTRTTGLTRSATPSQSATQSGSASQTTSRSQSATASRTRSRTQTPSRTRTASTTASATATPSLTPTQTVTSLLTPTATPSQQATPSDSPSSSSSPSQLSSDTPSTTRTGSQTRSQAASRTRTRSPTVTQSRTPSQSESDAPTPSQSPSASVSASASGSRSQLETASVSRSASRTTSGSPPRTCTPSRRLSPSPTHTKTASRTQTHSLSRSPALSRGPTPPPSATASPSLTASRTQAASASASGTGLSEAGQAGGDGAITVSVAVWGITGVLALLLAAAGACLMYCLAVRVKAATRRRLNAVVVGSGHRGATALLAGGLERSITLACAGGAADDVLDVSSLHFKLVDAAAPQPPGRVQRGRPKG